MADLNKIIYLDAAASALKSQPVIEAEVDFLQKRYANAGRGICARAVAVDTMVEDTRAQVAKFINAEPNQIVFTSGTTDGMNRIVGILKNIPALWARRPTVTVTDLDHHSARLPWEEQVNLGNCKWKVCPLDSDLNIDTAKIEKTDIFVISAMSNVLGMGQDVKKIIAAAREKNPDVITIVDAAQYVAHAPIDVRDWDCDYLCFSGHKIGADTGVGIMYIKDSQNTWPDKFGGGMVKRVENSTVGNNNTSDYQLMPAPYVFEAGTLPLTQIAGFGPAIDELVKTRGDNTLVKYLYDELLKIEKINIITKPDAALLSFTIEGMHVLDFGSLIGARGICLRVGNMCASWIHSYLDIPGSIRISVGPWNTMDEMTRVVKIIKEIVK